MKSISNLNELRELADEKGIVSTPDVNDRMAVVITRLAGDTLEMGEDESLILAMGVEGVLDSMRLLQLYDQSIPIQATQASVSHFDPFGDLESRGYLQNHCHQKDTARLKMLEHLSFSIGLKSTQAFLASCSHMGYPEYLNVHKGLFQPLYPWAGLDRLNNAPSLTISKGAPGASGSVVFAQAQEIAMTISYALRGIEDPDLVRSRVGTILGNLAFAHPFLDGNGRAMLTFHSELCFRAGFAVMWNAVPADKYLKALSTEINRPGKQYMDDFLKPFIRDVSNRSECISVMIR